jgi:predicted O-methyltransferase YrrM
VAKRQKMAMRPAGGRKDGPPAPGRKRGTRRGGRARRGSANSVARRLRRPTTLSLVALLAGAAAAAVLAVAGVDLVALLLGAATAAAAIAIVVVVGLRPIASAQRGALRGERQRDARDRARHARTRRAVDRAERRLFSQLEALGWLRDLLSLEHPLPPTRHWAASPDLLVELLRIIDRGRPTTVLELGSGVSTIVMAARLEAVGGGRLVALEHDPAYAAETRRNLALHGLDGVATVLDAPLSTLRVGEEEWSWYTLPEEGLPAPASVDLLLVDGPPGATGHLARYPALPLLAPRLAPGATIVVDDADRPDEREMARRWQSERPGLSLQHLPLESGAFVLRLPT